MKGFLLLFFGRMAVEVHVKLTNALSHHPAVGKGLHQKPVKPFLVRQFVNNETLAISFTRSIAVVRHTKHISIGAQTGEFSASR